MNLEQIRTDRLHMKKSQLARILGYTHEGYSKLEKRCSEGIEPKAIVRYAMAWIVNHGDGTPFDNDQ